MKRKNAGQMLVEVVVAIGIITVVLVGITDLMTKMSKVSRLSRQKDSASRLAQTQIDVFKVEKEQTPDSFFPRKRSDATCGTVIVGGTEFNCDVQYQYVSDNVVSIKVTESWTDQVTNDMNVSLSTILSLQ